MTARRATGPSQGRASYFDGTTELQRMPSLSVRVVTAASWVRLLTSSLVKMWARWVFTVAREIHRRLAMSGLDRPSVTSWVTSWWSAPAAISSRSPPAGRPASTARPPSTSKASGSSGRRPALSISATPDGPVGRPRHLCRRMMPLPPHPPRDMSRIPRRLAQGRPASAARLWLPLKSEVVEGLGGLGDGIGDGLVPVHVRPAGAQLPHAFIAQGYPRVHARRRDHVGVGGALDGRSGIRPGDGERACDHVEDEAHPETVTAPPEAANGAAAELERGGLIVEAVGDPGRPQEAEVVLVAERGAELAALAQAGAGLAGVGVGDGQAHGEQAARDEGRGADLAGERECFAGQRDRAGRVAGKHAGGHGDGELNGGVRQVAAGPREISGLFG